MAAADFKYEEFENEKATRSDRLPVNERKPSWRPKTQVKKKKITPITKMREKDRLRFMSKLPTQSWTTVDVEDALSKFEMILKEVSKTGRQAAIACGKMRRRYPGSFLYPGGKEGPVPQVEIGRKFHHLAQLSVLGIHLPLRKGIDWKEVTRSDGNTELMAISVLYAGTYENDKDLGEVVWYTGEGGRDPTSGLQIKDQQLLHGNLAMYNARIRKRAVRLVRRQDTVSGRVYVYDGMYKVEHSEQDKGISGFVLYRFKLVREANQKVLEWSSRGKRKGEEEEDFIASKEEEEEDDSEEDGLSDLRPRERRKSI